MRGHRPIDHPTAASVDHYNRQVQEVRLAQYIGDIGPPQPVGGLDGEVALDLIGRRASVADSHGGTNALASALPREACRSHQHGHALGGDALAVIVQLSVNPWSTIGGPRMLMNRPYPGGERPVSDGSRRWRPSPPRIVAAAGDPEKSARHSHSEHGLLSKPRSRAARELTGLRSGTSAINRDRRHCGASSEKIHASTHDGCTE